MRRNRLAAVAFALSAFAALADGVSLPRGIVVSGGKTIADWKVDEKGWWHAALEPGTRSTQFFVNRQRRQRPYLPRRGYFKMANNRPFGEEWNHRFTARAGDIPEGLDVAGAEDCALFHTYSGNGNVIENN